MKLIKSLIGTVAVLFSIQPLMSWAADIETEYKASATEAEEADPIYIRADGKRTIIIESQDEYPVKVRSFDHGKTLILTPKSAKEAIGGGSPQCFGGM